MNLRRIGVAVAATAALAVGPALVACGGGQYVNAEVTEDCDVEDQRKHEDDCGYWSSGVGEYQTGAQPGPSWTWIWWTWVVVGRTSHAPAGWTAPYGLKAPTKTVRVDRKYCALGLGLEVPGQRPAPPPAATPAPPRQQPKAPQNGGGNKAPANKPAAPKPPVYKPAGKVKC